MIKEIMEAIKICEESGRKPVLLLLHPRIFIELEFEIESLEIHFPYKLDKPFGLKYLLTPEIKDFQIIDDKSWFEQKW